MKKDTHPDYQEVLFEDTSTGTKFIIGSTLKPKATQEYQGKVYPVYPVSISSASHPFFTGSKQFIDTEGRVDKFMKRYGKKTPKQDEASQDLDKNSKK